MVLTWEVNENMGSGEASEKQEDDRDGELDWTCSHLSTSGLCS